MPVVFKVHAVQEAVVAIPIASEPVSGGWKQVLFGSHADYAEVDGPLRAI
jgi:predicted secreted protein